MNRRGFIAAMSAGTLLKSATQANAMGSEDQRPTGFGLSLGGGAARGLAHIVVLEVLDEMGVRPAVMSGTSMGAIIGACYASGMTGLEIRAYAGKFFSSRLSAIRRLLPESLQGWRALLAMNNAALLDPEELIEIALPNQVPTRLEDLEIPLLVVAADFHNQSEYVFRSGPIKTAVGASAALPVILSPVKIGETVLIDGGFVNPTPYDLLSGLVSKIIAVDVTRTSSGDLGEMPGGFDSWIGSAQIAIHSLVNERLARFAPDVLIRPPVSQIKSMDFDRLNEILEATDRIRDDIKRDIEKVVQRL